MGAPRPLGWSARPVGFAVALLLSLVLAAPAGADFKFLGEWGQPRGGELVFPAGVGRDNAGNTYVLDSFPPRVHKYDAAGNYLLSWGSYGTGPGEFGTPGAIGVNEATGEVYVYDAKGRPGTTSRIQRFDSNGNLLGEFGSLGLAEGQFGGATGIAVDQVSGDVFVVDLNRVQRFSATGQFELMWGKDVVPGGGTGPETCTAGCKAGEPGTAEGELKFPDSIAVTANQVFVSEDGNSRISRFNATTGAFQVMGGKDVQPGGGQGHETCVSGCKEGEHGSGPGELAEVRGIDVSPAFGFLFIADRDNHRVQRWTSSLTYVSEFGTEGTGDGQFEWADGVTENQGTVIVTDTANPRAQRFTGLGAFQNRFGEPGPGTLEIGFDLAAGPGGVYATDRLNRVLQFDPLGGFTRAWGSTGSATGQFLGATGIAAGADGNVYVADQGNARVQRFDATGAALGSWGTPGTAEGQFDELADIAVGPGGDVYTVEATASRVQKFSPIGAFEGTWGAAGDAPGQFDVPQGIAVDADGNVYVVDTSNNRIQKFDPNGQLLTTWGANGTGDGQFDDPADIAVDGAGNVFVVDAATNRVQRFSSSGEFRGRFGANGGDGTLGAGQGEFNTPLSIAVDAPGYIYVLDQFNDRIEKFVATPELALTAAPSESLKSMLVTSTCRSGPCAVELSGAVAVKGHKARHHAKRAKVSFPLAPAMQALNAGAAADAPLTPQAASKKLRKARRLLKHKGRGTVTVNGVVTNEAGQGTASASFKLKRR